MLKITPMEITELRGDMTKTKFAAMLNTSPMALIKWENGKFTPRGPTVLLLKMMQKNRDGMIKTLAKMMMDTE